MTLNIIKTIDLWTEQWVNHSECFCGAFVDGFENANLPFNQYKVIRNCNCIITNHQDDLHIRNKHNAIIFYKDDIPVRLMVINQETNIDQCIEQALNQSFHNTTLRELYDHCFIKRLDIDLKQQPVINSSDKDMEMDVGSCDRPSLLECMLQGSYTQSDTAYGKNNEDHHYHFVSDIFIQYSLVTDQEQFQIEHYSAFLNETKTRIIPLQENSALNIEEIKKQYKEKVKKSY